MDNPALSEEANMKKDSTETHVAIDMPSKPSSWSWSRLCDVMGNRQQLFIDTLRPLKTPLTQVVDQVQKTTQRLATLQMELERKMRTYEETKKTSRCIQNLIVNLNAITNNGVLNVPPDENEMLRSCAKDLSVLGRVIDQLIREDSLYRQQKREQGQKVDDEITPGDVSPTAETTFEKQGRMYKNASSGSAVDEHSLKERIDRNSEMLEKLLKFVDKKTERRWWLRDCINFAQMIVKVALFISASIAVFYPSEQIFPIITLGLTIGQGVIEVMDQYFLKNTTPEDIKMHVVTTLSASSSKG